ncbi:MAG: hypothetical protein H0U35_08975 [Sporichthyaceae bacterium]|nr:hypothetical protein [Sporichthyaceae bacterium]
MGSRREVALLLAAAGFTEVALTDVTGDYLVTVRAWLRARDRHRHDLALLDAARLEEQQHDMAEAAAAIEAGLLRRSLVLARRSAGLVAGPAGQHTEPTPGEE